VTACPFCDYLGHRDVRALSGWIASNAHAIAVLDKHPVSEGPTLVVPHRHVESIFQLGGEEQTSVWNLVTQVRDRLRHRFDTPPDGFNVGPNDGVEAGQTVLHSHVHVIPRYRGDVPDPRGGIRWVIPRKANYWDPAEADPFQQVEFLGFIQSLLEHGEFVSTYKFALVQGLADLSLEKDSSPDGTTRIPLEEIAAKFVSSYWMHSAPFHFTDGTSGLLRQNNGRLNIAILRLLSEVRSMFPTLGLLRQSGQPWKSLLRSVARRQVRTKRPKFRLSLVWR
jgi:diadenosine tetraphosphate (Ap4A) HIT family hydrolase